MKKTLFLALLVFVGAPFMVAAANAPEPPRASVDAAYPELSPSRTIRNVRASCASEANCYASLQRAIDDSVPGDEIVVDAAIRINGPVTLKRKSGDAWIVIRSSRSAELPPGGKRIGPEHAMLMPDLVSPGRNQNALNSEDGAHHYRLVGLEFAKTSASAVETNLIYIGRDDMTSLTEVPHHIVFDRIYAHGDPASDLRRCMTLNAAHVAVIDSHLSDCHEKGADSQAIAGWNGPGPFLVRNNRLEGAGENILFGGANPRIPGLVPSDIEIVGNHVVKPLAWKTSGRWTVKNLFELKAGRRVRVSGNLFENSWTDGQTGIAILLKSTNPGQCDWCVTEHVIFENNIVREAEEAFTVNAREGPSGSPLPPPANTILIRNNLFENIARRLFYVNGGASDVSFDRNTALTGTTILLGSDNPVQNPGFSFTRNLIRRSTYGIGTGANEGTPTLETRFSPFEFTGNVIVNESGGSSENILRRYPAGTEVIPASRTADTTRGADLRRLQAVRNDALSGIYEIGPQSPLQPPALPAPSVPGLPSADSSALRTEIARLLAEINDLQNRIARMPSRNLGTDLRFGMRDHSGVRELQAALAARGYYSGPQTGNFLQLTLAAVKRFQAANGVPATGFVGPLTRAALNSR